MSDNNLKEIAGLISDFLEHLEVERGLSLLTVRNYRFWLMRFAKWLSNEFPGSRVADIDLEKIRKFRLWLGRQKGRRGSQMSLVTQGYHAIALRSLLKWCSKMSIPALSPENIDVPKSRSRELSFLLPSQVSDLLNSAGYNSAPGRAGHSLIPGRGMYQTVRPCADGTKLKDLRDRALLETLFSTGLRVSELVKLNRDKINLDRGEFSVIGKGGRARVVYLSKRAIEWINKYFDKRKDHYRPVFIRVGGKKPEVVTPDEEMRLTPRSVQRLVEYYRLKSGVPIKITPHGLRHSFATDLLQGGADLRAVQELLGHKNIATTQIYTHVTNRELREVHQRAHSGNR
ncbi:tyrosine-type recombinase/integrase [Candidatus Collierbacteria bacterium]|nr:tyrosine-type recombinase/integrase [Candidatus Collierbacteria bacterium]